MGVDNNCTSIANFSNVCRKVDDVNEVGCGHCGGEGFRRSEPIYSCEVSQLQVVDNMVNASAKLRELLRS